MRHALLRLTFAGSLLALLGCVDDGLTEPRGSVLTPGLWRNISGRANEERNFTVTVPAGVGTLRVELRGGIGVANLFVRFGAEPEPLIADCQSTVAATVQECLVVAPQAGTWHIEVIAADGFANVALRASFTSLAEATPIASGAPLANLMGGEGSFRLYSIDVPAGHTLTVTTTGGTGDADLYIRRSLWPLLNQFDCASIGPTTVEECTGSYVDAQTWYVRLEGWDDYSNVTLTATVTAPVPDRVP